MNFMGVTTLKIPEGNVVKITRKNDGVVLWSAGRLPSEYQEVEWIGTDGNSYFVSDFTINDLDQFTLYYTYSAPSDTMCMFGSDGTGVSGVTSPRFLHRHGYFIYNQDTTAGNVHLFVFKTDDEFHSYKMEFEHQGEIVVYLDGVLLLTHTFYNAGDYRPFGVFCNNYKNLPTSYLATKGAKIAELRFVDDTTGKDVFNPVPCYRKSDGVIGMYDTVSKTFYTNEGTGAFTKGADV